LDLSHGYLRENCNTGVYDVAAFFTGNAILGKSSSGDAGFLIVFWRTVVSNEETNPHCPNGHEHSGGHATAKRNT
jgi:hypothetical protein